VIWVPYHPIPLHISRCYHFNDSAKPLKLITQPSQCWDIPELKHTQIYVVRQLAYSTELLSCINHSKKQYKQRRRRKLFSTQLHSHKLSLLFSLLFCSLCVFFFYTHTRSSSLSLYVYKMGVKGHKSCLDLCPPFVSSTMCQVGD
jgi:lipopolysaccharide export LptBFGC system permease protein LptF